VSQLERWIRTPGSHQPEIASATTEVSALSPDERFQLIKAFVEAETASAGNSDLRVQLLSAATAIRGDGRSKAARRLGDRLEAIQAEATPENEEVLGRVTSES
jgi:hypothetical protein